MAWWAYAAASLALEGARWIYHRLTQEPPPKQIHEATFPVTEEGAPAGWLFGRYRVHRPVLAWVGDIAAEAGSVGNGSPNFPSVYRASMLFEVARGFTSATNNIHGGWIGNQKLSWLPPLVEVPARGTEGHVGGLIEVLDGNPNQVLVHPSTGAGVTAAGTRMRSLGVSPVVIPGYRGRICAFLYNSVDGFYFGPSGSFPSVEFEASSYHTGHSQLSTFGRVGSDSNPINVIYEILTSPFLMGLPESVIDFSSFKSAQYTLHTETHGYSRFWAERVEASEMLADVLRQIDGLLYFDHRSEKIKIKLIRPDFQPSDLFEINRRNCMKITAFAMGGRTNIVNNVVVKYRDRAEGYEIKGARAVDEGNIAGHDEQAGTEELDFPGCCDAETARRIAARELYARSMPQVKCRAVMKRTALRVQPGDPVRLVWTNPDVNAIFRVVGVDRGSVEDGAIVLDLVNDTSYVWRNQTPQPGGVVGLPRSNPWPLEPL